MKLKRDPFWDIVKGIGIILVVLGHAGFVPYSLAVVINYFHLGVFFFTSGALFNPQNARDLRGYVGKKLRKIYLPTMKYVLIFIALHNVFLKLNIYATVTEQPMIYPKTQLSLYEMCSEMLRALFQQTYSVEMAGAMWMVFPLMGASILFCSLFYITGVLPFGKFRRGTLIALCLVLGAGGSYMVHRNMTFPWRMELAFLVLPLMICAWLYEKHRKKCAPKMWFAVLSAVMMWLYYRSGLEISYAAGITPSYVDYVAVSLMGVYVVLYFADLISRCCVGAFFAFAGEHSFDIMALHFLAFKLVNYLDVMVNRKDPVLVAQFPTSNAAEFGVLYLAAGVCIPLAVIMICRFLKSKLMNLLERIVKPYDVLF